MNKATFDPARRLDLYFRCARDGSKDFVFTYSDGTPYSFIYEEFQFNIYRYQGEKKVLLELLTVSNQDTLTSSITVAQSNIDAAEYYYELFNSQTNETWLCGNAIFHNGKFDGVSTDTEDVTIQINGELINITLEVTPPSSVGVGSVTSVGGFSPLFTVTNPTSTPTFVAVNQNANLVYAGPATGIASAPTFRALVAADLPSNSGAYWKTSGTSILTANVSVTSSFVFDLTTPFAQLGIGATPFNVANDMSATLVDYSNGSGGGFGIGIFSSDTILGAPSGYAGFYTSNPTNGEGAGVHMVQLSPTMGDTELIMTNGQAAFDDQRIAGFKKGIEYSDSGLGTDFTDFTLIHRLYADNRYGRLSTTNTWAGVQTFSLTSLYANNTGIDVVATGGSDILNIGTSNADVINIGYSGSTINITGTLAYQNVTNLQVTDKLFTVNKGGGVGSGVSSGFEIEENAIITGYFATNGTRDGWDFKAPAITGVANLSLASLTGNHTYTLPDASGTIALTSNIILPAQGGTGIANNNASTITISGNFATTLTVTALTSVTLPTTGTLATLAGAEQLTNKTLDSGTVFSADPTINDGITFTFNPDATNAGLNFGVHAGDPTNGGTNGNAWYNSTTGSLNVGKNNIVQSVITSAALTSITGRVPFISSSSNVVTYSANFQFTTNRLFGTTLYLTLSAGTATAGTGPLKMTSGTNLTTAEAGTFEYNGADLFFTKSGTTRGTVLVSTAVTTEAVASDTTLTITHAGTTYKLLARA